MINKKNKPPNWKGEKAGYQAIHQWVRRHKQKTGKCVLCNKYKETIWANVDHKYKRDLDDYIELCRTCHALYDGFRRKNEKEYNPNNFLEENVKSFLTRFMDLQKHRFIKDLSLSNLEQKNELKKEVKKMAKKSRKKSGWHDFKHGSTHERRLYKKGKVIVKIPIKRATKKRKM